MEKQNLTVTYKCGHTGIENCKPKNVKFFETQNCPSCEDSKPGEKPLHIPSHRVKLSGSDKQISWANQIRENIMSRLDKGVDHPGIAKVVNHLNSITSASWWIDHEGYDGESNKLLAKIHNELK